jgi:uncharacterized repeat protein (TIGR03803 family)
LFRITNAGSFKTLNNFDYDNGADPNADLVVGADGLLYGTTGGPDPGTVFAVSLAGSLNTLFRFDGTHGSGPAAGLVMGLDGNFYGTTLNGGASGFGTAFRIDTSGNITTLYSFGGVTDGGNPQGSLLMTADGTLYGTTRGGDTIPDGGGADTTSKFFSLTEAGVLTPLATMPSAANGDLVAGTDGSFYGTSIGTASAPDAVFKATPAGGVTTLHTFPAGSSPNPLVLGPDGAFYGTTYSGGSAAPPRGTVFKIGADGSGFSTLYSFLGGNDGAAPLGGLILASDGSFYGTTTEFGAGGYGTVFKMGTDGQPVTLYAFTGGANGANPMGRLLQAEDGNFYGVTGSGGDSNGGTLFELDGPPLIPANVTVTFSGTEADLSWTASGGATSYNVYLGTTAGGESATPAVVPR